MKSYSPEAVTMFSCRLSFPQGMNSKRRVQFSSGMVRASSYL